MHSLILNYTYTYTFFLISGFNILKENDRATSF